MCLGVAGREWLAAWVCMPRLRGGSYLNRHGAGAGYSTQGPCGEVVVGGGRCI